MFARVNSVVWALVLLLLGVPFPAGSQTQADYLGTNVTGVLAFARTVNLRAQVSRLSFAAVTVVPETKPKAPPPRLRPPVTLRLAATAATAIPARSLTVTSSAATGFNALSHLDQRLAFSGNQFSIEPPSQSIAVGNGYVLEGVNDAVQVYTTAGTPVLSSVLASNQVFGVAPAINRITGVQGVYLTDMRVYFDGGINRWFVVQRAQANDADGNPLPKSALYVAVSKTEDPAGDYLIYVMDTTNGAHPGCPCISDYPQIGSDQHGFHISFNEFNAFSLSFVDASILSISKAALASGAATPAAYQFIIPFTTGYEFAIQPATTPPGASNFLAAGGLEYFVSSSARFSGGSGVALWSVRNTSSLATPSPLLILSRVIVTSLGYTVPDVATQRPGLLPYGSSLSPTGVLAYLDGGDNRVRSATYAGGRLYLAFQTGILDETNRWVVGAAYIVLSPVFRETNLSASILNQGYLLLNGNHLLRPAIAVTSKGRGAIAVTLVGTDWHPTAALIPIDTFSTPSKIETTAVGAGPEDGFTGYPGFGSVGVARWGDYNGAVASADGAIWTVVQYIGNYPRTPLANWNTHIARRPM
jgi:hypothetical protein